MPWPWPDDWNERFEAPEFARRWVGRPESSAPVGCQSMGCMRSSKLDEGRSFHLRKRVQARKIPPIEAATATITVRVVRVILPVL